MSGALILKLAAAAAATKLELPLDGLVAWYDPSDIETLFQDAAMTTPVTADGQNVRAIVDKTLNGNNVLHTSGGASLVYRTTANDGDYISCNTFFLECAGFLGIAGEQQVTIIEAWEISSFAGTTPGPLEIIETTGSVIQFLPSMTVASLERDVYVPAAASTAQDTSNTPITSTFFAEIIEFDGTQAAQADRMNITQNGKDQINDTLASIATAVSSNTLRLRLFGRSNTSYVVGNFWGALVYDRLLTAQEKEQVFRYLYSLREIPYIPDPDDWYQSGSGEGGVSVNGGPNPYSVNRPGDIEQGDMVFWLHLGTGTISTSNVPWVQIAAQSTAPYGLTINVRQATAAEPSTYTFTKASGTSVSGSAIFRIRGGIIKVSSVQGGTGSNSANTLTVPTLTPVHFTEGIRLIGVIWLNPQTMTTEPSGMTRIVDVQVATVPNAMNMRVYMEEIGPGATGTKTINFSGITTCVAVEIILS